MPTNIPEDDAREEDYYEEIHPHQEQGRVEDESYVNMGMVPGQGDDNLYQNEPPIYQNIHQRSKKRKSVFGENFHSATGHHVEGPWIPSYQKGISTYPPETTITLDQFLNDYETYLSRVDNAPPADKENSERLQFLLHTVFPYLERKLAKTGIDRDIMDIVVRLSCCKNCSLVTRHALHMILDILSMTSYDAGGFYSDFIVQCESHLRDSINGRETPVIDNEIAEDQGLRVLVYSRVLIIFYAKVEQGLIPLAILDKNENYGDVVKKVTQLEQQSVFQQKDGPRYAVRCIKEIQARVETPIKKKNDARKNFLIWLQEHNSGDDNKSKRDKKVEELFKASKKTWFDFHVVLFCLASQLRERPKNIEILHRLVETYVKRHSEFKRWSSEGEWQTGLVLGGVLEDIVNHNQNKDTRTVACLCLVHYFENLTKRNSIEKLYVRESLQHCLFGPVENVRQVMLNRLGMTEKSDKDEQLPITRSMDHLLQTYKKHLPKSSVRFIGMSNEKGYYSVTFRGENATIKIPVSTQDGILQEEKKAPTKVHQQLVVEAYTLRRLNSNPHPNILRVFAYDTSAQPYHLITEQVAKGSLLKFLQDSRSQLGPMPSPSELIKMMLGVVDAAIYLNEQHLVHLAIMADNILVGQNNVCKLTGFQFTREMTNQANGRYEYVSPRDEMPTRHAAPECFTMGQFSEKSVSWAIGVTLFEMHTYGVSPYNQYSSNEADRIPEHVINGGKLKMEDCIRKEVQDLIGKCTLTEKEERPDLLQIKQELERICEQLTREDDCPAASFPSLTNVDLAQAKDAMNTSSAIEDRNKEKIVGFFGSPTRCYDLPKICDCNGVQVIRELVLKTKQKDLDRLKNLKHKNIVAVKSLSNYNECYIALATEYSGRGNLLQVVLKKQFRRETLVTFTAQIAQAIEYMHENDMIHGDLRAEHIMIFHNKVKLARLGRSKSVGKIVDTKCKMPQDAVRWSPPEVIKDGIYSHSSDVYSFGIMCFELFAAFCAAEGSTAEEVKPFPTISDDQVLAYLEGDNRPTRPESMPIWYYIIVKQCLLHMPAERPPFVLIVDALTSSKPFESCLLSHWIKMHSNEADNLNVYKTQPEGASHLIPNENHKTFEELHKLVAVEVFLRHTYSYKPGSKFFCPHDHVSRALQDQEETYEDVYDYDKANCRFPESVLGNVRVSKVPEDIIYEQISHPTDQRSKQPLPPTPTTHPIQETGSSTLVQEKSKLALYATSSIIDSKSSSCLSLQDCHSTSETYHENIEKDNNSSPVDWPSLPAGPPNRDEKNINQNTPRGESSHVFPPRPHPTPAPRTIVRDEPTVEVDIYEGAAGGEPVQDSWYSMQSYMSGNDNGATECSFYSMTPLFDQPNGSQPPRFTDNSSPGPACQDTPVPLPRNKQTKRDS